MAFKTMRMRGPSPAYKRQKTSHTDHVKLARLQRQVAALSPEVKIFDSGTQTTGVVGLTSIFPLSLIGQGTNAENRIGDSVTANSIEVKINANSISGGLAAPAIYQIGYAYSFFLVKDLESNGVVPVVTGAQGIFAAGTPTGCLQQPETAKRFKILAQKTFTLTEIALQRNFWIHWNVKLGHKMTFHDATFTQTA